MFSDDDDFSDDLVDDFSDDSPAAKTVGNSDDDQFRELVGRRAEIEQRMNDVDELARQIKFAMELQRAMCDCYSNRVEWCPVETKLEVRILSSRSSLLVLSLRNNTDHELVHWTVTASICSSAAEEPGIGTYSQCVPLMNLSPGEEFSTELLFPYSFLQLPILVRLQLKRVFRIYGEDKCIMINLDSEYLSLRNLLQAVRAGCKRITEDETASSMGNFTLRLPFPLVNLLSGCPDDNDPANVLRVILPRTNFCPMKSGSSSIDAVLVLDSDRRHRVQFTVTKERSWFLLSVALREASLRNRLRQAIQMYIVHITSRVMKRSSSASLVTEGYSIEELFDGVVSMFS
ncbi:unnamed protein product [Nippostrongylus brasiliensis]|uniref:Mab-21 domain-containing protein n=1 Tax=Nippostrongylus brasiliensis TaxID=27835 RepID=A0A0N4YM58_NIPBR|nr:unnamed protein product [Nippostrongylus brasiliensis]